MSNASVVLIMFFAGALGYAAWGLVDAAIERSARKKSELDQSAKSGLPLGIDTMTGK